MQDQQKPTRDDLRKLRVECHQTWIRYSLTRDNRYLKEWEGLVSREREMINQIYGPEIKEIIG